MRRRAIARQERGLVVGYRKRNSGALAALLVLAALATTGFIHRVYSIREVMDESNHILLGKIESVDARKKQIVAGVEQELKGKGGYTRVQMNFATGDQKFIPFIFSRVSPGQSILVFYQQSGRSIACLCYVDKFWYQLFADDDPRNRDRVWWKFSHVEIYMNRTYDGPQADLAQIVGDALSGKGNPPGPNKNKKPLDVQREMARAADGKAAAQLDTAAASPAVGAGNRLFGRHVNLAHGGGEARGAMWIDFDGDGDLDVYCCCSTGNRLYRYDGGTKFRDVTRPVGLAGGSRAAAWADYNGDGKLDLLLSTPKLYTNRGGKFSDDTRLLPKLPAYNTEGCGWLDYDGDGAPDVLLTNGEHGIALFKNEQRGAKPFRDVSAQAGLGPRGPGNQNGDFVSVADWDGDGFSDFLYNVGSGFLFRNNGQGRFELAAKSGVKYASSNEYKIGTAWGDYDNDGDLDLYVPQDPIGRLFRNNNDGSFTDVTKTAGDLQYVQYKWTAGAWGDVDGDGWLDLYVGKADGDARLFINQRNGRFENQVEELGLYHLPGNAKVFSAALADFDRDGDLDILANSVENRCTLFINDLKRADSGPTYLAVRPKQPMGAVGATVRLFDTNDRLLGLYELGMAQNMGSQSPLSALFGVPTGKYKVTICMSDGGFGERIVEVGAKGLAVEIGAEEK